MTIAELILLRKTLHPEPLTVTVAVHSLSFGAGNLSISGPLTEHLLTLNQLPPSGYDVFNVTASLPYHVHEPHILGFQLCFKDESGSLVLHEALTQSLYCLNTSSLSQPLLVTYKVNVFLIRYLCTYFSHDAISLFHRGLCMRKQANLSLAEQKPNNKHLESDKRYLCLKQVDTNISVVFKTEFLNINCL